MPISRSLNKSKQKRGKKIVKKSHANLKPLRVTLVSGFLGSGKTSLLRHILNQKETTSRYCIIVNEISEFNVDAITIEKGKLLQTEEKLVEMSNGCICCTLREDLLTKLKELYESGQFDRVLIESSGISEPIQVAETFFFPVEGKSLQQGIAPLTNCVSVVDASTIKSYLECNEVPEDGSVNEKDISSLLLDQLEFANVIVLNKLDLVTEDDKNQLLSLVHRINPTANIIPAVHSKVDLHMIVGEKPLFDEQVAFNSPDWMRDVNTPTISETVEYGISSFAFRSDRPFHPQRLFEWITNNFVLHEHDSSEQSDGEGLSGDDIAKNNYISSDEVLRAIKTDREAKYGKIFRGKGFVWIASEMRLGLAIGWSQAGDVLNINVVDSWENWSATEPPAQRLIFIGQDLKQSLLTAELEALLLTDSELQMVEEAITSGTPIELEDPFVHLSFEETEHDI